MSVLVAALTACSTSAESLEGVWAAEKHFGPKIEGNLTLWHDAGTWRAEIAGLEAPVSETDGLLQFELPGGQGSFRAHGSTQDPEIRGHWIQSPTEVLWTPYASPVRLVKNGSKSWRGSVQPLKDQIHLYLAIQREPAPDEADAPSSERPLRVFLRNPERNLGIYLGLQEVRQVGERVLFLDAEGATRLEGTLRDDRRGTLSIYIPNAGATFDFRRVERADAPGFFPQASTEPYSYEPPQDRNDGWAVASAGSVGLDPSSLTQLVQTIRQGVPTSVRDPYIHSILVARGGKLVLEEYFHGHGPETTHDTRSAGKSLASMIAGAAMDRHSVLDADTPMLSVLGADADEPQAEGTEHPFARRAAWRRQMTLGHMLSMSSGLDCNDGDSASPGNEDRMQSQSEQPDWARYTLDLTMVRAPGSEAYYCSATINLALATIARATGRWLPEAFGEWIAEPLGIERYHFNLTPTGQGYMGGGIRLTPRDQLKLGQVMLHDGLWKGRRVLSSGWVRESTSPQASVNEPDDYGYGWWVTELEHPGTGQSHRAFHASGNGGQLVIVVPDLDLVVQYSAGNYSNFPVWIRYLTELTPRYILAAVGSGASS